MTNLNTLDRLLRVLLGLAVLELAFFWLAGLAQIGAWLAGAVLLGTAAMVGLLLPLVAVLPGVDGDGVHEDTRDTLNVR